MLRETGSGYSSNCDEAMFGVLKASLSMFREYSPSRRTLPLTGKESSPADEEEIKIKMVDGVDSSLASEGTDLFAALSLGPIM